MSAAAERNPLMLPPPPAAGPAMKHTSVYVREDVLDRIEAIAEEEGLKGKNKLLGSFLAFAVDLFPLLRPMQSAIEAFATAERKSYAEAVAILVRRGLKAEK